jgi:type II secretion system protein D
VLNDAAKSLQLSLVMPEIPAGTFSRVDWRSHSPENAVRILNRQLETGGYRLLLKPPYLIVLDASSERPEYTRPVVPNPEDPQAKMARLPKVIAEPNQPSLVRPVSYASGVTPEQEPTTFRVPIGEHAAAEVAARLFEACEGTAPTLRRTGHAASFRVNLVAKGESRSQAPIGGATPHSPIQFDVTVDAPRNELIVRAPHELVDPVAQLVRSFATKGHRPTDTEKLVSSRNGVSGIARNIQQPLESLRAARRQTTLPRAAVLAQRQTNANPSRPLQDVTADRQRIEDVIEELRGNVSVHAIEDLGVLIIRGEQNDVDAVARLVQEIEQLGVGAPPQIHLLILSHVGSVGLAELLDKVFVTNGGAKPATVSVTPVSKPNSLIIVASHDEMATVLELASKLDQPGDPRAELGVFPLKSAIAAQVKQMLDDFYDAKGTQATGVRTVVDVRTNSVIVQGAPRDLKEVEALIRRIDHDESKSVSEARIFPLENAVAEDLALVINSVLRSLLGDGQGRQTGQAGQASVPPQGEQAGGVGGLSGNRLRTAKSVVLQFLAADGSTERRVRSGILEDIRVNSDPRTNSLVVTAPEQSMRLMAELITHLDLPTSLVSEIKVFTLANADAGAMARLLQELFVSPTQQKALGVQLAGAEDASSNLIPMRFSVDVRTNSILATGGAEALRIVEAVLLRLDQSDLRQRQNTVYRLRNSPAEDVAKAINQFLSSQRNLAQVDPNLVSTVELLEREVIVVPEPVSNSLLISSTPRYYDEVLNLTTQLDEAPPQVIIQALLVEVDLNNADEFGVELGVQDSVLFNRSIISDITTVTDTVFDAVTGLPVASTERIVSQQAVPGFDFNNQPLGNNPAINTSRVGGQGLSNFSLGRINGDLGYGGLVLSAGSESVNVLIRALAARRKIHVLSRPQIRTLDNQQAFIQVGEQVPIVDGVNISTTGSSNPVIRQDQAGIILSVTPRISPDDTIVMEVIAEKSAYPKGEEKVIFVDTVTGAAITSPVKKITTAQTTVSVPDQQTIVLGGMITTVDAVEERKIPWLGDIPVIGHAFRHDKAVTQRTELLIFLTPRVIHNSLDSEMIKQVEAARIGFLEGCAEEIHGPIFSVEETFEPLPMLAPPVVTE